jgi:hypothetical protein
MTRPPSMATKKNLLSQKRVIENISITLGLVTKKIQLLQD